MGLHELFDLCCVGVYGGAICCYTKTMDDQPQFNADQPPVQDEQAPSEHPAPAKAESISWEASEYVHYKKDVLWYVGFAFVMAVLIALAIWIGALTFIALVIVMGLAVVVISKRPPRVLHYSLDAMGIKIDERFYGLDEFKSFSINSEGAFYSIMLIPVKRFMPAITLYFEEKDGEKIVDILGARLPMQHIEPDFVDRLFRQLRF